MKTHPFIIVVLALMSGCATNTIVTDKMTSDRLDKIIIPEVALRGATMPDVVEFLAISSIPVGHPWPDLQQTLFDNSVTYQMLWDGKKRDLEYDLVQTGPRITFSAKNISLMETIKQVVRLSDGTCNVGTNVVTITTRRVQQGAAVGKARDKGFSPGKPRSAL